MNTPLRTAAEQTLATAKLLGAIWYAFWSACFVFAGLWIALPPGNGFLLAIGLFIAFACGGSCLLRAAEAYMSARPQQRSDELQRYRANRMLYDPQKHETERQERNKRRSQA